MQEIVIRFRSKVLHLPVSICVLTPDVPVGADVAQERKYKAVWMLHGGWQDCFQWFEQTNIKKHVEGRNAIFILPSAINCDYGSYPDFGSGYDYPKFFFEELMPFIYSTFPVSRMREDNYIMGQSMGGFGTAYYMLLHPEKFAAAAPIAFSMREPDWLRQYADMDSISFRRMVNADRKKFPAEYGRHPELGIGDKEVNLICKYPTVRDFLNSDECFWERFPEAFRKGNLPRIMIACGKEDRFYPRLLRFKEHAESLGCHDITYRFDDGFGHVDAYFDHIIPFVFDFFHI